MLKITGKQSRAARSLLKWNLQDLAQRVKGVVAKRVDSFEHGLVHLMEWENDELVRGFKKAGIIFKADLEVALEDKKQAEDQRRSVQGDGMRIVIDSDDQMVLDPAADNGPSKDNADMEDDKRKENKKGNP